MQRSVALLLLLAAVGLVGLLLIAAPGPAGSGGSFHIQVLAPSEELFNGTVQARVGTAYSVLVEAAKEGGFAVEAHEYPQGVFVHSIGGHENRGASGWCYYLWEDGWTWHDQSADNAALRDGHAVRWEYKDGGCGP